jgi:hypothetical protein
MRSSRARRYGNMSLCALAGVILMSVLFDHEAFAQGGAASALAETLFDEGRALLAAGRVEQACAKFEESQRLEAAGGTLLNLALCREAEGKTATAWVLLRDARAQASRDGRRDREAIAEEHLAALAPRLMRLRFVLKPDVVPQRVALALDGVSIPEIALATAVPVDPGAHLVSVRGAGYATTELRIEARNPGETLDVTIPSLVAMEALSSKERSATPENARRSTAFWITLSAAGALLAASAVTGGLALADDAYVRDNCSRERDFCSVADASDAATRAQTLAWVSTGALVAGIGAAVVAFVLPRTVSAALASSSTVARGD